MLAFQWKYVTQEAFLKFLCKITSNCRRTHFEINIFEYLQEERTNPINLIRIAFSARKYVTLEQYPPEKLLIRYETTQHLSSHGRHSSRWWAINNEKYFKHHSRALGYEAVQLLNLHIKYCHKTEPYNWKLHSPAIFWPYPIAINYAISRQSTSRPQSRSLDPVPTIWCGATGARWSPAKYIFIRGAAKLFAAHWLLQHVALRVSHYLCIGGENGTLPRPPDIPALGCTSHVFGTTRLLYVNQFSHKLIRRLFLSTNTNPTCVSFTPVTLHLGMLA